MRDDLGHAVPLSAPARRVVSLVPSITEAIAATIPGALAGATQWCSYPAWLEVPRVRGTKNPDLARIASLEPDLVIANQEENRRFDMDRMRDVGQAVWVTRIDSIDEAIASLGRLFQDAFGLGAVSWLGDARTVWAPPPTSSIRGLRVAVPVWRDPWMWVGRDTYIDDVLHRLGCVNVVAAARYPALELARVLAERPDVVLLPDEPYPFSRADGPEAIAPAASVLVPGRALAWYGPAMVWARPVLEGLLVTGLGR